MFACNGLLDGMEVFDCIKLVTRYECVNYICSVVGQVGVVGLVVVRTLWVMGGTRRGGVGLFSVEKGVIVM